MFLLFLGLCLLWPLILFAAVDTAIRRRRLATKKCARAALDRLGMPREEEVLETRVLDGSHANVVVMLKIRGPHGTRRIVLKQPLFYGTLLAFCGRWLGPMPYARGIGTRRRARREVLALSTLLRRGHSVSRCLAWDDRSGLLALEWIDGVPASSRLHREGGSALAMRLGGALANLHQGEVALCDAHPGNVLVRPEGDLLLLDLEFAVLGTAATPDRKAFDLAYAAALMPTPECRGALLSGYGPAPIAVERAFVSARRAVDRFSLFTRLEVRRAKGIATQEVPQ